MHHCRRHPGLLQRHPGPLQPFRPPLRLLPGLVLAVALGAFTPARAGEAVNPPIHVAFLWHMHQPIYWPYESVVQTDALGRYGYSVTDIHNQRTGPYTSWPKDAVLKGMNAGMPHFGAQVSFSGSLIENLDNLEAAGNGNFQGWKGNWSWIHSRSTSLGNPRIDLVGFGYHHPLMGLLGTLDLRKQIEDHRAAALAAFGGPVSRGIFPPENAFSPRMIPALAAEGLEWVLVDNVHFDRAAAGYPYSTGGNLVEPNRADVRNPDPGDWVQLTDLWAPTRISGGWGHRPHWVEYTDPATGAVSRIVAVPADRYMGNEDGRGGFGALQYDAVMSQLEAYNTDPAHPLLVVLHHDGDNYGGGTDSYYGSNFQAFVDWLAANPTRFVCTTVQDYLDQYPPDGADVIHVEDGSWSGADNGDPEFKKWLGDPAADGYSPDRNSWAVVTAARNVVHTAEQVAPGSANTLNAWKYLLNAEASDYWYWDGAQDGIWDSHPTRAANQALPFAQAAVSGGTDLTGPTIFLPQREPYNPGGTEWGIAQPADFTVWTYVYDLSGLDSVTLKVRTDLDGVIPVGSAENATYAGGPGVSGWTSIPMTASDLASRTDPLPLLRAQQWSAPVPGYADTLVEYMVEAVDGLGNVSRSPIRHVWVGASDGGGAGGSGVAWTPSAPTAGDPVTVTVHGAARGAKLHWGVNAWQVPIAAYRPAGTVLWGTGDAVETPMVLSGDSLTLTLGPFNDPSQPVQSIPFVIHYDDDSWDNNGGSDYVVPVSGGDPAGEPWVLDGALDAGTDLVAGAAGLDLHLGWNGSELYLATQAAGGTANDAFIFLSDNPGAPGAAPWAKGGQVAAWSAFLGNESGNNWAGWFDQTGSVAQSAGTWLEGTVNLASEFGSVPPVVYVAVGRYGSADGGALVGQVPAGNGDGSVDATEYFAYTLPVTAVVPVAVPPRPLRAVANPFRGEGAVRFTLPEAGRARVEVFDLQGRLVATALDRALPAGEHAVPLAMADRAGGIYFVRLTGPGVSATTRVVLLR